MEPLKLYLSLKQEICGTKIQNPLTNVVNGTSFPKREWDQNEINDCFYSESIPNNSACGINKCLIL